MTALQHRSAIVTLPDAESIQIVREFAAPRHLVYRAFTEPDLVRRWWAAGFGEMTVAEIDLRVGGRWRYAMVTAGDVEVAFHGEYREIVPNERVVCTEVYEGMEEGESLNTATFAESGTSTVLTLLVRHDVRAHRDAHLAAGMETGMQRALNLLEDVAASLR